MPKYLFSYHLGEFPPEFGKSTGAAWGKWLDDLGERVVDRGGPLQAARTVASGAAVSDTGPIETTGYSVIRADSMEAALAIAAQCPQIRPPHRDGTVEVAELIEM